MGRHPHNPSGAKIKVAIRLPPNTAELLRRMCEAQETNPSVLIQNLIEHSKLAAQVRTQR